MNIENQNFIIHFGENLNFIEIGNPYLGHEIENESADGTNFTNVANLRLFNNGLTYVFQECMLSNSSRTEIEYYKYLGPVSKIMRFLTHKVGDLYSFCDKIGEREVGTANSSLTHMLIGGYTNDANKGKIKAHLPLEHNFGFRKWFQKVTEGLGLELQLKTSNEKQGFFWTNLAGNAVNVTINILCLYLLCLVACPEQQQFFNEPIKKTSKLSFDFQVTDQKPTNTGNDYQLDKGSASNIIVPLFLIAQHQKTHRDNPARPPNQFNIASFDIVYVRR